MYLESTMSSPSPTSTSASGQTTHSSVSPEVITSIAFGVVMTILGVLTLWQSARQGRWLCKQRVPDWYRHDWYMLFPAVDEEHVAPELPSSNFEYSPALEPMLNSAARTIHLDISNATIDSCGLLCHGPIVAPRSIDTKHSPSFPSLPNPVFIAPRPLRSRSLDTCYRPDNDPFEWHMFRAGPNKSRLKRRHSAAWYYSFLLLIFCIWAHDHTICPWWYTSKSRRIPKRLKQIPVTLLLYEANSLRVQRPVCTRYHELAADSALCDGVSKVGITKVERGDTLETWVQLYHYKSQCWIGYLLFVTWIQVAFVRSCSPLDDSLKRKSHGPRVPW